MKTSLLQLILYIAPVCLFQISQYLGQYQFQCVRTDILERASVFVFYFLETLPADIERCAIEMGGIQGGVAVAAAAAAPRRRFTSSSVRSTEVTITLLGFSPLDSNESRKLEPILSNRFAAPGIR